MSVSKMMRSGIRRRWQPSGWVSWRCGSSAANWSHSGSRMQDGRAGTGDLVGVWWHLPRIQASSCLHQQLKAPVTAYWRNLLAGTIYLVTGHVPRVRAHSADGIGTSVSPRSNDGGIPVGLVHPPAEIGRA